MYSMYGRYEQRVGVRATTLSTYDRTGGNEAADASHYLWVTDTDAVAIDVRGWRGVMYFMRANRWHGR